MPTYIKLKDLQDLSDENFFNDPPMPGDCYEKSILYPIEVARRQRLHQYELDLKLIKKQTTMTIYAAIIGAVAALTGAFLGAYWQNKFQSESPLKQQQQFEQRIERKRDFGSSRRTKTL